MELEDPPARDAGWEAWLRYGKKVLKAGRMARDPATISYGRTLVRNAEAERDRRATETTARLLAKRMAP